MARCECENAFCSHKGEVIQDTKAKQALRIVKQRCKNNATKEVITKAGSYMLCDACNRYAPSVERVYEL